MIRYKIYQNQQKKGLNAGKWFARAVSDETFRSFQTCRTYVKAQFTVFQWGDQRRAH